MRILLGVGVGAEWPARAALAMESWAEHSRGLMSGILQGSWKLGILPALVIVNIRFFLKELAV
jgi:SHS family lactate transporter-like MFS transporter